MVLVPKTCRYLIAALISICLILPTAKASTGCRTCAEGGSCKTAFHSGPGKYCGQWMDSNSQTYLPCCCPLNSVCKVGGYSCNCHVDSAPPDNHVDDANPSVLAYLVLFLVICMCCYGCCKAEPENTYTAVPSAPPAYNPSYTGTTTSYQSPRNTSGGGGGGIGSALLGGALGFTAGTLLGGRHHGNSSGGGGYNITGDSGGGGYDIAGDSGGGDFSGDF
mmetsp:Transcript_9155/g.13285  ORF Transcript_9155/g.13285 Transcript_9155/m.13285 type:complete len:220 (-) Transcript_9155:316-975(-)